MIWLIGGIISALEIITIGTLLKIGGHVGARFLKDCGQKETVYPKIKARGRKRVLEQTTGTDLSLFSGGV